MSVKKDIAESMRVANVVHAAGQQCYRNAFRVIKKVPEYSKADYVEGIATFDKEGPIEHGWIETKGVVIDPTLPQDEMVYFPGLRFTGRKGLKRAMRIPKPKVTRDLVPIFYRFGWGGRNSPAMLAAWAAAYHRLGWEDSAKRYENQIAKCNESGRFMFNRDGHYMIHEDGEQRGIILARTREMAEQFVAFENQAGIKVEIAETAAITDVTLEEHLGQTLKAEGANCSFVIDAIYDKVPYGEKVSYDLMMPPSGLSS
jgi:hypothetical protein